MGINFELRLCFEQFAKWSKRQSTWNLLMNYFEARRLLILSLFFYICFSKHVRSHIRTINDSLNNLLIVIYESVGFHVYLKKNE